MSMLFGMLFTTMSISSPKSKAIWLSAKILIKIHTLSIDSTILICIFVCRLLEEVHRACYVKLSSATVINENAWALTPLPRRALLVTIFAQKTF